MNDVFPDAAAPEAPAPPQQPLRVETGIGSVDGPLELLAELDTLEVDEHPRVFDAVHAGLRDALSHAGQPDAS